MIWSTLATIAGRFLLPLAAKNKYAAVVTVLLLLAVGYILLQHHNPREIAVAEHNMRVANDSVRVTVARDGSKESDRLAYLTDKVESLKKLNAALYEEVKKTKGGVSTIVKAQMSIVHDTVALATQTQINDSTITTNFSFDTTYAPGNGRRREGFVTYDQRTGKSGGELTKDETSITLVTGIKNLDKGSPEIFVRSPYPGLVIRNVEGAVLDKNLFRKRQPLITIGASIGWVPVSYDLHQKTFDFNSHRIGGSLGITFNLFRK